MGAVYANFNQRLLTIDTTLSQINISLREHGELLARLDERTRSLDRRVEGLEKTHFESKAKASGFKNPDIVPISLTEHSKFESKTEVGPKQYSIRYTVLGYNPMTEVLSLSIDADLEGGSKIRGSLLALHIKPGEKKLVQSFEGEHPAKIFMQILERPSPDRVILAIGEKIDQDGKGS